MDMLDYFAERNSRIISFVGAGGKTTAMYTLAAAFAARGLKTLVTTTTHIEMPDKTLWAKNEEEVRRLWQSGSYAVVGTEPGAAGAATEGAATEGATTEGTAEAEPRAGTAAETGTELPPPFFAALPQVRKITGLSKPERSLYFDMAEVVLIEADGAKRMPCKVPAAHEPMILKECDTVVGVMGIRSVGRPLREVCFRLEEAQKSFGCHPDERLTPELAAEFLASELGTKKNVGTRNYCVMLNPCDGDELLSIGSRIRRLLEKKGIYSCMLTAFRERGTEYL